MSRGLLFFLFFTAAAFGSFKYHIETESRYFHHTAEPMDPASLRHSLEAEGNWKEGTSWSLHGGAKGYVEGAFASNESRYGADLRRRESQDVRLKDFYLQYKSGGWTVRAGNQQIVWGEAFGFYYADFVNPKDVRELGLGPLEKNRVSIPMLSVKTVWDAVSIQGFFVPKPYFNLTAAEGGDFSFPFGRFFPGISLTHTETANLPIASENFEGGVRVSSTLGKLDLALLFASYNDRSPVYSSSYISAASATIVDSHPRMKTAGITGSLPCGPFICRGEILWHFGKWFNTFQVPDFVPMKSDEFVAVFGFDYTEGDKNRIGLQVSENLRSQELSGALMSKSQQNISLQVRMGTVSNHRLETIFSFIPGDKSVLLQAQYLIPVSSQMEFLVTGDTFFGEASSQFGQYRQASRVGGIFKLYFSEG